MPPKAAAAGAGANGGAAGGAAALSPQELTPTDYASFRTILALQEAKDYKKAIKVADTLLKKYPVHGETMALKALALGSMYNKLEAKTPKRREEAAQKRDEVYALIKKAIAFNVKSPLCWHSFGLIYRQDSNYEDAIKCYQNALKREQQNNVAIIRDMAHLQLHMHMYDAFREARQRLLQARSTQSTNWLFMALALHFCGEWEKATKILDASLTLTLDDDKSSTSSVLPVVGATTADDELLVSEDDRVRALEAEMATFWRMAPKAPFAESEIMLYRYLVTLDSNDLKGAYNYLVALVPLVTDKLFVVEHRAFLLTALNRLRESEVLYRSLIRRNPDRLDYHHGLLRALRLRTEGPPLQRFQSPFSVSHIRTSNPTPTVLAHADAAPTLTIAPAELCCDPTSADYATRVDELYTSLAALYPHSLAISRLPLTLLPASHPIFHRRLAAYMHRALRKGIPSLFSDLHTLYDDADKARAIETLALSIVDNLRAHNTFEGAAAGADGAAARVESPSCLLWALYFVGQHYDHRGDHVTALKYADEAYRHTPTCLDTIMLRARILKHAGAPQAAYASMDQARQLDLADRYINTKCVRYAARAGRRNDAEYLVSLFLRDGDGLNALNDTQSTWYERALGTSYEQSGQYGRALKQYMLVDKHFGEFIEGSFDFHVYGVRKGVLRALVDFIDWHVAVRSHRFFLHAAHGIVRVYLRVYEAPIEEAEKKKAEAAEELTDEERKLRDKLRKKQAMKDKKKDKHADDSLPKSRAPIRGKAALPSDPDADGHSLLQLPALEQASKYLAYLQQYDADTLETWLLSARVAWRKAKWLLMWRAIKRGLRVAPEHPELHFFLMVLIASLQAPAGAPAAEVPTTPATPKAVAAAAAAQLASSDPIVASILQQELTDAKIDWATPVLETNAAFAEKHAASVAHRFAAARVALQLTSKRKLVTALLVEPLNTLANDAWQPFSLAVAHTVHTFLAHTLCNDEAVERFTALAAQRFPLATRFGALDETLALSEVRASPSDLLAAPTQPL